jgi:hypothetical protein
MAKKMTKAQGITQAFFKINSLVKVHNVPALEGVGGLVVEVDPDGMVVWYTLHGDTFTTRPDFLELVHPPVR